MMEHALIEYIVNALWQVPLIAGAAWLLARLVKPGPRLHHGLWLAALGLALLLPLRGLSNLTTVRPQNPATVTNSNVLRREEPMVEMAVPEPPRTASGWSPRIQTVRLASASAHWIVRLYLATVMFGLLRIARAWRATRVLVAHAQETLRHKDTLATYSRRLKVKLPEIRESREVSSPIIVGIHAPVLLLPAGFERFEEEEIEATLCHELAHIKRWDYAVNIVCQVAALPLIWHPVAHEIQQRIRLTRELVCDAMAAQEMKSEIGYAKCLLALANSMLGAHGMNQTAHLVGLLTHNNLEERVTQLMEKTKMNLGVRLARTAAGAAVTIASFAIASSFHVTPMMAQSNESNPSHAQTAPEEPRVQAPVPESATAGVPVVEKHQAAHRESAHAKQQRTEEADQTNEESRVQMEKADALVDDPEFNELKEDAQRQVSEAEAFSETPEFKKQMKDVKEQIAAAQRQAMKAKAVFDTPEFKKQMEEAQRQAMKAKAFTETPEFKQQMEDIKKHIEDAQQQSMDAKAMFDTPEFKKQMEDAREQASKAKAFFDSPEFKRQMENAQRQAATAREMFDTPEFKQQMEGLQKETEKVKEMMDSPEFKERMEQLQPKTESGEAP